MVSRRMSHGQIGVTIVELVVTIVILGIALLGVVFMLSRGLSQSANTLVETQAIALGHAYLDEILSRRFDENSAPGGTETCHGFVLDFPDGYCTDPADLGPDGEISRISYDDVDDFHGLDEGFGAAQPDLLDADGMVRTGYDGFRVRVEVRYAGDDAVVGGVATDAKVIQVRIDHRDSSQPYYFSAYKGNY